MAEVMVNKGWCSNLQVAESIVKELEKWAFNGMYVGIIDREYNLIAGWAKLYLNIHGFGNKQASPEMQRRSLTFAEGMLRKWETNVEFRKFIASTISEVIVKSKDKVPDKLAEYLTLNGTLDPVMFKCWDRWDVIKLVKIILKNRSQKHLAGDDFWTMAVKELGYRVDHAKRIKASFFKNIFSRLDNFVTLAEALQIPPYDSRMLSMCSEDEAIQITRSEIPASSSESSTASASTRSSSNIDRYPVCEKLFGHLGATAAGPAPAQGKARNKSSKKAIEKEPSKPSGNYVLEEQRKIITSAILKAEDPALGGNDFFQSLCKNELKGWNWLTIQNHWKKSMKNKLEDFDWLTSEDVANIKEKLKVKHRGKKSVVKVSDDSEDEDEAAVVVSGDDEEVIPGTDPAVESSQAEEKPDQSEDKKREKLVEKEEDGRNAKIKVREGKMVHVELENLPRSKIAKLMTGNQEQEQEQEALRSAPGPDNSNDEDVASFFTACTDTEVQTEMGEPQGEGDHEVSAGIEASEPERKVKKNKKKRTKPVEDDSNSEIAGQSTIAASSLEKITEQAPPKRSRKNRRAVVGEEQVSDHAKSNEPVTTGQVEIPLLWDVKWENVENATKTARTIAKYQHHPTAEIKHASRTLLMNLKLTKRAMELMGVKFE